MGENIKKYITQPTSESLSSMQSIGHTKSVKIHSNFLLKTFEKVHNVFCFDTSANNLSFLYSNSGMLIPNDNMHNAYLVVFSLN